MIGPKFVLRLSQMRSHSPSDQGLSLLECLMAIVVIAITGAMIIPPLFVATATRVQNRRAEQALSLAQGEVERVRSLVEQQANAAVLPSAVNLGDGARLDGVAAPTGLYATTRTLATCDGNAPSDTRPAVNEAQPIDMDGDCSPDFLLQSFRSNNTTQDFKLGIRVYSKAALTGEGALNDGLQVEEASMKFTTATGNQAIYPLAVIYTDMNAGNASNAICQFQDLRDC